MKIKSTEISNKLRIDSFILFSARICLALSNNFLGDCESHAKVSKEIIRI